MPVIREAFDLMGNDMVELSQENGSLKNKICSYDKRWLEEPEAKPVKEFDDEKIANIILPRMEKQMNTQQNWMI